MKRLTKVSLVINVVLVLCLLAVLQYFNVFGAIIGKVFGDEISEESIIGTPYYEIRNDIFNNATDTENEIIFLGDSLTDNNEWGNAFSEKNIINRGINGDTTLGVFNRIENVVALKPKKIFIMAGFNDISRGIDKKEILKNYESIIKTLQEETPETEVFVHSILPINDGMIQDIYSMDISNTTISEVNSGIKNISESNEVVYLDLYSNYLDSNKQLNKDLTIDGIHLNAKGYNMWESILANYIK